MAVKDFLLEEFNPSNLEATKKAWRKILHANRADFSEAVYERKLERASGGCEYVTGTDFCYGIFRSGTKIASAITEISYTRSSSKWIKMLELHLSPELDLSVDKNQPDFKLLADIFSAAIIGTIRLTGVHKSRVIKLYARTTVLLSFFKYIAETLPAVLEKMAVPNLKVSIDGRWLVMKL